MFVIFISQKVKYLSEKKIVEKFKKKHIKKKREF